MHSSYNLCVYKGTSGALSCPDVKANNDTIEQWQGYFFYEGSQSSLHENLQNTTIFKLITKSTDPSRDSTVINVSFNLINRNLSRIS